MSQEKICLDVGGTALETTLETLEKCKTLHDIVKLNIENQPVFIDRDPKVFEKALKFLRGYPMHDQLFSDNDVLHELIHWNHILVDHPLPDFVQKSVKTHHAYDEQLKAHIVYAVNFTSVEFPSPHKDDQHRYLINTPDIKQLMQHKDTHYLVPENIATHILNLNNSIKCNFVCSKGWDDHVWIEKNQLKIALYKLKLRMVLYPNNNWSVYSSSE